MFVIQRRRDAAGKPVVALYERDDGDIVLTSGPIADEWTADMLVQLLYEDLREGALLMGPAE